MSALPGACLCMVLPSGVKLRNGARRVGLNGLKVALVRRRGRNWALAAGCGMTWPGPTVSLPPRMDPVPPAPAWSQRARAHWLALREHAAAPQPPPRAQGRLALVRYGLAQPFLGLRTVVRSPDLLGIALAPALGVLLVAGVVAWSRAGEHGALRGVGAFLITVAALAPMPPLLFGRVYAHLAAKARLPLGLPPAAPYLRSVVQLVGEWLAQLVVLALGVLPYVALARLLPGVGPAVALALQGAWALCWVVVEGYDNARTLPPGRTVEALEAESRGRPGHPWFHRWHLAVRGPRWLLTVLAPLRMLSEVVTSLSRPWRVEVDLSEREPWISLGFGLGAASMLAVPGLNLLFRPAVVVAGVHLRQQLLGEDVRVEREATNAEAGRASTQPYPAVPPEG